MGFVLFCTRDDIDREVNQHGHMRAVGGAIGPTQNEEELNIASRISSLASESRISTEDPAIRDPAVQEKVIYLWDQFRIKSQDGLLILKLLFIGPFFLTTIKIGSL